MPQANIFIDEGEDTVVKKFSELWNLSKAETIKKIIMEFDKLENGNIR